MNEKKKDPEKDSGLNLKRIARIHSDFPTKFGIPRQSGLVPELRAKIVFEPEYRRREALEGLEGYSHIWLIWEFSESAREGWSATVRPPRLGGNTRKGVFATRSPFRPNALGLSCVELIAISEEPGEGTVLWVSGADLMDGTPIYDIKPYLPFADAHPGARAGFAGEVEGYRLEVDFPRLLQSAFSDEQVQALIKLLAADPRPAYQRDPERIYGMPFAGKDIRFRVAEGRLTVQEIVDL
ncbi:MAG TPA: tRNA (N6-threonylcarbamoyladenosine(37)-N6)-methyltransferase TrmO [Lachnospiraceae bacterium]|nr:tRNA (N6-threonylcarbamoyladenosine(37)-N6)-methyltransferase TrmO [Lachnospiraceae bacterium]